MQANCERVKSIPEEMTDPCKDTEYALEFQPPVDENVNYYIGWDPAISPDRKADYTCMMVADISELFGFTMRKVWTFHHKLIR